ncbi:Hpt domain-containing protein [Thioclava atlantica]|uniref:Hpt domain-containing protein n=1 Tax=Thioclava atlantica TaxID=1317124 RepID=A0A085TWH7_9RHOB|nr:Hpt domain-containing protein [Thioclava atlantica]KFE35074.1 Hpt domain-containing protein [Thioclava atlantica]
MIDWDRVRELRSEIGADGFAEVVDLFLDEVESVVMSLGQRPARLEEDLHFLKGSAWNLGFRDFGGLCQQGERLAAAGAGGEVNVPAILEVYSESKTLFMGRLAEFTEAA